MKTHTMDNEKAPVKTRAVQVTFDAEVPEASEKVNKAKGYVAYGDMNLHPQWLFKLAQDSPVHGGIINQKTRFIHGNGVEVTGVHAAQSEQILKNGDSPLTINEVLASVTYDSEVQAYLYYHFKRNVISEGWNVTPLSAELMRPSEDLQTFHYSENWAASRQNNKTGYKAYKSIFNVVLAPIGTPGVDGFIDADNECVMYVKKPSKQVMLEDGKTLTTSTFPTPAYSGAIPSIMANIEMNFFTYAEVVNGFTSNTLVNLNNGEPADERKKEKMVNSIGRQTGDRKKSGGVTVMFNDGVERAATVEQLGSNDNATRYILAQEAISDTTMIGHSVQTPELFGVLVSGKLGGTTDLPLSFERFQHTYSEPERLFITNPLIWALSKLNNLQGLELSYVPYAPPLERQIGGDNPVADAINSMSPLVATKFLEQLTSAEVRALGGLPALAEGETTIGAVPVAPETAAAMKMSSEDEVEGIIAQFSTIGTPKKDLTILGSRAYDLKGTDEEYKAEFTAAKFAIELSVDQQRILQMIAKGESFKSVVNGTGLTASQVGRQVLNLTRDGLVNQAVDGKTWELTTEGKNSVATEELIDVKYTYELRADAPALVEGGKSRPFCSRLVELNRAYTREEIDLIQVPSGRNVWLFRGGWYHDPAKDINQPSCRHFWQQQVVLK